MDEAAVLAEVIMGTLVWAAGAVPSDLQSAGLGAGALAAVLFAVGAVLLGMACHLLVKAPKAQPFCYGRKR